MARPSALVPSISFRINKVSEVKNPGKTRSSQDQKSFDHLLAGLTFSKESPEYRQSVARKVSEWQSRLQGDRPHHNKVHS